MEIWECPAGTGLVRVVTIRDEDGAAITSYLGTETLIGKIWAGQDAAALITLTPTWRDHAAGTVDLTIPKTATAIDPGQYVLQLSILDGVTDPPFFRAILEITDSPGTATAVATYCTLQDMLDACPWIQNQSDIEHDQAGFVKQRGKAREWLDRAILAAHRPQQGWGAATFGNSLFGNSLTRQPGVNKALQDYLAAGKLMVDSPRPVAEMTARYAIGLVLQSQITSAGGGPKGNPYAELSGQFFAQATNMLVGYVAEVDINADGYPEYVIPCGTLDILRG